MAPEGKKTVNIFKLSSLSEPKQVIQNWRLWFAVLTFALLGTARGIDEGLISGAFKSRHFQESINYSSYSAVDQAKIKANVASMVQLGCIGGAMMCVSPVFSPRLCITPYLFIRNLTPLTYHLTI
jgi:hypothetical protein